MNASLQQPSGIDLFAGASELAQLMRTHDWSATPLGPVAGWPHSLKVVLRILLDSRYAMWLGWGPELTFFYNDAYARMTLGAKHPWALGRSAKEVWAEIWSDIGPRAESVVRTGQATWDERLLLFLERRGFTEESYHTFSYSPVPNDQGGIGGMLCVVTEDTERTIGERRLKTLRELAAGTTEAGTSAEEACRSAARVLSGNPHDLPFVLLYLIAADGQTAQLACSTGLLPGAPAAPAAVDLAAPEPTAAAWPLRQVLKTGHTEVVTHFVRELGPGPIGAYPEPPHTAAVLPLRKSGQEQLAGFLVAGVSPRRPFDDDYRGFLDLLAGQIATAVANARAYEDEKRRAEGLAELDRAKTTFFSNVSHEFRTPLTLLLSPVEELLARPDATAEPDRRELLELVHRNGLRLQKLVNTLLDFSRIEAGRLQATYEPVDLATFTAELASNFRSACERAGLEFVVTCPPVGEPVYVDRDLWEKIVLNLLSNAFKFTWQGRIEVSLQRRDRLVELAVRDTGTGIPPAELPHLFERFHRVEGTRGRTQEGSGIGLALVRELARLHGGDVRAESQLDAGSTFFVTLPLGSAHLPPARVVVASEEWRVASEELKDAAILAGQHQALATHESGEWRVVSEELKEHQALATRHSPLTTHEALATHHSPLSTHAALATILLADDNADMRDYICRLLAGRYEVTAVADGLAAREAVRQRRPDLVLSDVMMPGLDGFALLREWREDPHTQGLPVILLSARAGEEARVEGLQAGADDYLTKPFSARELLVRVASTLEIARLRRAALVRERTLLAEVEEQRNWLRVTLASIGDAVIATDHAGRASFLNPVAEQLTGWRDAEARGRTLDEIFAISNEATGDPTENPVARVLREGVVVGLANHTILTARDGTQRPIDDSAAPIKGADGTVLGVVLTFRDVGERRRVEREIERLNRDLQRRVVEFQTLLEVIPIGIAVAEAPDCQRIWSNPALSRLLRLPPSANISLSAPAAERPSYQVFDQGRLLSADELPLQQAIATGQELRGVKHDLLLHDGTRVSLLNYAVPLFDEAGRIRGGLLASVDITEQQHIEQALRRAEERWRTLTETLPNLVWTALPDGRCDWLSSQWGQYTGIPETELLGLSWLEHAVHPEDRERTRACWQTALADKGSYDIEYRLRRYDRQFRWFKTRGVPIRDDRGQIVYWFGTCTDIEEQKRAEEALREADRRKDEFLATLAHELRNPLAPIRNSLQILKMPRVDPGSAERARDMMERQVQQLVRLVDDLLDVSRVMRGKITLHRERIELATVVARAVETAQPVIEAQQHELIVALPDEVLLLDADLVRLAQVVANLLTNAAKYTEPAGRLELTARRDGSEAVLSVRDNGIGIASDMLPRIFELFVQADHAATRSQGGLGIGLTLVKNLVEMHQGTVVARSAGLGQGSELIVRLPLAPVDKPPGAGSAAVTTPTAGSAVSLSVVVVDDSRDAADSLAMLLRLLGHVVRVAHDGKSALDLLHAAPPHVVFLDIGMPGMDGYEVARRIRLQPALARVRLIALTGWGQEEDRRRSSQAGFDYHLVKPVDPSILADLLAEFGSRKTVGAT